MPINGVITRIGRQIISGILKDASVSSPLYVAWGTDSTAPDEDDLTLAAEQERYLATYTNYGTGGIKLYKQWTLAAAYDTLVMWEIGIFDAVAGGNMLFKGRPNPLNALPASDDGRTLATGDTMTLNLILYVAAGSY